LALSKGNSIQSKSNSLIVTHGHKEMLTGAGAFFIRTANKPITNSNIYTDVSFGPLNANILPSLTTMVKNVVFPALAAQVGPFSNSSQDTWGVLSRSKDESVKSFMEVLEKFTVDLDVAMVNLQDSVQLAPCSIDLENYKKPSEYSHAASSPEVTSGLESNIKATYFRSCQ
jgi:dynein heavy chain